MCPDDQILSAYLDGELSSEERGQVETALDEDSACWQRYMQLRQVRDALVEDELPDFEESERRVWARLEARMATREQTYAWQRSVRVPLPAMIAAASLFVVLTVSLLVTLGSTSGNRAGGGIEQALASANENKITINVDKMETERFLEWLNSTEVLGEVNIQLPERPTFDIMGEPRLVPASEYRKKANSLRNTQ